MQTTIAQTKIARLSVQVSGGELASVTYPDGKVKFWFNTHPVSKREFGRILNLKRPA